MHQYYHSEQAGTDLAVMREQANVRTRPDNKFNYFAENSVIHHHRHGEPCTKDVEHEFYTAGEFSAEDLERAFWHMRKENSSGSANQDH